MCCGSATLIERTERSDGLLNHTHYASDVIALVAPSAAACMRMRLI
jgi:hypothetical protein